MRKMQAVFLDRDGTIIEDRGHLGSTQDVHFFDASIPSLQKLQKLFMLFIVTHQPGISRGLITKEDVDDVNTYIRDVLMEHEIHIQEIYVCPHDRSEGCSCIKPNPYFLLRAEQDYNLDLQRSFTIGDHPPDVDLGKNAGATGIFLLSGHGKNHRHEIDDDTIVVPGIGEAVTYILDSLET